MYTPLVTLLFQRNGMSFKFSVHPSCTDHSLREIEICRFLTKCDKEVNTANILWITKDINKNSRDSFMTCTQYLRTVGRCQRSIQKPLIEVEIIQKGKQ